MKQITPTFREAQHEFVKALHAYHTATRDMSLALQRVTHHTQAFYKPLKTVLYISGSMITPGGLKR